MNSVFILERIENPWNYTFIIVAVIAIGIGVILEYRRARKSSLKDRRDKRNNNIDK